MKYIIDVRENDEFKSGHVAGAVHIPVGQLSAMIVSLDEKMSKDDNIIVYCRSGMRAGMAMEMLKKHGFTNVVNGINKDTVEARHV